MANLYYKIWTDAIFNEQSKKTQRDNWQLYTLIPVSLLMGVNLLTFFYWMKVVVNKNLPLFFDVEIFNAHPLNGFISIIVSLFLPFLILNYLLVFYNERYKQLQSRYPDEDGKLYKRYVLISLGLLIVPIIIQKMFFQVV